MITRSLDREDRAAEDLGDRLEDAFVGGCPAGCYDPLGRVRHAKPLGMASHRQHLTLNDGTNLQAGNDVDDKHGNLLGQISYKLMNVSFLQTSDGGSNSSTSRSNRGSDVTSLRFSTAYRWKPTA